MKCNGFQLFVVVGAVIICCCIWRDEPSDGTSTLYKMHIQKHYRCDQDAIGHTQNSLKHTSNIVEVMLVIFLCESRWWVWCLAGSGLHANHCAHSAFILNRLHSHEQTQ